MLVLALVVRGCAEDDRPPIAVPRSPPARPERVPEFVPERARVQAPPTPPPPSEELPEPEPDLVSIVVRDLADGTAVPLAALAIPEEELHIHAIDGKLVMLRAELESGNIDLGKRHHYAGRLPLEPGASHYDLWVYREGVVRGNVRLAPGVDRPERAELRVESGIGAGRRGVLPEEASPPWTEGWLIRHRFTSRERVVAEVRPDGSYELPVRLVRGLMVIARPPGAGLAPDVRRIDVSAGVEELELDLNIREQDYIEGSVTIPDDGVDPETCMVSVHVDRAIPIVEFDYWLEHARGQGMSGGVRQRPEDLHVDVSFVKSGTVVRKDGSFRIPVLHKGRALLIIKAPGCIPEQLPLGDLTTTRTGVNVTLRRVGDAGSLQLLRDGERLGAGSLQIVDGDAEAGQPALGPIRISASGAVNAAGLEDGRRYFLLVRTKTGGSYRGWVTWVGQSRLDVSLDLRPEK